MARLSYKEIYEHMQKQERTNEILITDYVVINFIWIVFAL